MEEWRARRPWLVGNNFRMNLNGTLRAPSPSPPLLLLSPTTSRRPSTLSRSRSVLLLPDVTSLSLLPSLLFLSLSHSSPFPLLSFLPLCSLERFIVVYIVFLQNTLSTHPHLSLPTKLRFSSEAVVLNRRRGSDKARQGTLAICRLRDVSSIAPEGNIDLFVAGLTPSTPRERSNATTPMRALKPALHVCVCARVCMCVRATS